MNRSKGQYVISILTRGEIRDKMIWIRKRYAFKEDFPCAEDAAQGSALFLDL